jgi:hypothetical protein
LTLLLLLMYGSSMGRSLLIWHWWWRAGVPTGIDATLGDRSKSRVLGLSRASSARIVSMDVLIDRLNRGWLEVVVWQWRLRGKTGIYIFIIIAVSRDRRLLRNWRRVSSWRVARS